MGVAEVEATCKHVLKCQTTWNFFFAIWNLKFFKFFQNVVTGACPQCSAEAMLIFITDLSNKDKKLLDVQEQKFLLRETSVLTGAAEVPASLPAPGKQNPLSGYFPSALPLPH